jgi:predicted exporter
MALGFGIVLLGIGVDFAVHIYLGCNDGGQIPVDLKRTLSMAFVTTIAVFTVLLFSTVPAHRQMALLSIAGLSWALVMAWHLVPSLAEGKGRVDAENMAAISTTIISQGEKGSLLKVVCWICLIVAGFVVWPQLHYDGDLRSLDVPSKSVKNDEKDFINTWGQTDQAFIIATETGQGEVLDLNDRVYDLLIEQGLSNEVQSLSPFLPGPGRQRENIALWQRFWEERLPALKAHLQNAAVETGFTVDAFQPFTERLAEKPEIMVPKKLVVGPLRPFISSLFRKVTSIEGEADVYLAATMVPDNVLNIELIRKIGEELPGVTVMSNDRWRHQIEEHLKSDIVKLSAIAGLLVILICAIFLRRLQAVFAALAPVLSALSAMSLFSFVTGGSLNIMHLLMGIMVIGLSVDYGIFIVRAYGDKMDSKAFSAVSICALSTLSGFGVLAFAAHPALSALGTTVLVGIGAAWPTALFLSPAMIYLTDRKGVSR